jgi:hypothetical protein
MVPSVIGDDSSQVRVSCVFKQCVFKQCVVLVSMYSPSELKDSMNQSWMESETRKMCGRGRGRRPCPWTERDEQAQRAVLFLSHPRHFEPEAVTPYLACAQIQTNNRRFYFKGKSRS